MIITFCGHSDYRRTSEHEEQILAFLEKTVGDRPASMYLGGYGDFDHFAYACCKRYQEDHPQVSLVFVSPYACLDHPKRHLEYPHENYDDILYPDLGEKPLKFKIAYRNRYMAEQADLVIAYVSRSWGDAYKMYLHAKRKGKPIWNLALLK